MGQFDGMEKHNAEQKEAKKARMRLFADSVIDEYRKKQIVKGVWAIAEELGLTLGTLNRWSSDPDWQEIARELRLARILTLEEKSDRAIVNGEERQWIAVYLGLLNRLDPVKQNVEHSGQVATVHLVTNVRIREEEPVALPAPN